MSQAFDKVFPDRFYTPGINEPGMLGMATGLAMAGYKTVACDMSVFLHHAYAHIRAAARQGNDLHLIIAASHTGVAVGPDGGSAHDLTDIARMRLVPGFNVITPWDGAQVRKALDVILEKPGFYYVRLNRPKVPTFLKDPVPFEIGKAYRLKEGNKITIIASGDKVFSALEVADKLGDGVADVIGLSTVEPLDNQTILESARRTGKVVTIEDHLYIGGLFESVAGVLALNHPVPMRKIAIDRMFTTSGEPDELAKMYGIDTDSIVKSCREFVSQG